LDQKPIERVLPEVKEDENNAPFTKWGTINS
jgi:hypothetical protein